MAKQPLDSVYLGPPAPAGLIPNDIKPSPAITERLAEQGTEWRHLPDWYRATTPIGYRVNETSATKTEQFEREKAEWEAFTPSGDMARDLRELRFLLHEGLGDGVSGLDAQIGAAAIVSKIQQMLDAEHGMSMRSSEEIRGAASDAREMALLFRELPQARAAAYGRFISAYKKDAAADALASRLG